MGVGMGLQGREEKGVMGVASERGGGGLQGREEKGGRGGRWGLKGREGEREGGGLRLTQTTCCVAAAPYISHSRSQQGLQ